MQMQASFRCIHIILKASSIVFAFCRWKSGNKFNESICVWNRCNEEINVHVLCWWLYRNLAQRKTVSIPKPTSCCSCSQRFSYDSVLCRCCFPPAALPLEESPLRSPWMETQRWRLAKPRPCAGWPGRPAVTAWGLKFTLRPEGASSGTPLSCLWPWTADTFRRRRSSSRTSRWGGTTPSLSRTTAGRDSRTVSGWWCPELIQFRSHGAAPRL